MGYIVHRATSQPVAVNNWSVIALYVFAANAPDLDFIPGLFVGQLSRFHRGPSHSVGFAVLFATLATVCFRQRTRVFVMAFSLYLSHVLLDSLVQDPSPPHGVPLLWPFRSEYYMAPFAFFPRFDYDASSISAFVSALFSFNNLVAVTTEIALLFPLLILASIREFLSMARTESPRSGNRPRKLADERDDA
jgi:inner membrane protein